MINNTMNRTVTLSYESPNFRTFYMQRDFDLERIYPIVKANLIVLGTLQPQQKITELSFNTNGSITKLNSQQGKPLVKTYELKKFTQFVQSYLKKLQLSDNDAYEIRQILQKAEKGIECVLLEDTVNRRALRKAHLNVLLNERMETTQGVKPPGEDFIIKSFENLQAACKFQRNGVKHYDRFLKVTTFTRVLTSASLLGSSLLSFFFPLPGLIVVVTMLALLSINEILRFLIGRDTKKQKADLKINLEYLEEKTLFKKHYQAPELERFTQFINGLPRELIENEAESHYVHRLYEKEKKLAQTNLLITQENNLELKQQLEKSKDVLQSDIIHLRSRLHLS